MAFHPKPILFAWLLMLSVPQLAFAQLEVDDEEGELELGDDDSDGGEIELDDSTPTTDDGVDLGDDLGTDDLGPNTLGDNNVDLDPMDRKSWGDILTVIHKPFLKRKRVEFLPLFGVTMNDNLIRHFQFGGQLNYYLTDVLAIGLEGQYFAADRREPYILTGWQARRIPTLNEYNYGASLNFHYVPIFGKFVLFDKHIMQWETFFTLGVGIQESSTLSRDPRHESFDNFLITANAGAAMRFFPTRFLTIHLGIRDYMFLDQYEATNRTEVSGSVAKDSATSSFINHVVFQAGISVWIPFSFDYTTFR